MHQLRDSWLKVTFSMGWNCQKPQTLLLLNSNHFCHPILSQFILQTHKERKREEESLFRYSLTIATKFRIKEDINFAGSSFVWGSWRRGTTNTQKKNPKKKERESKKKCLSQEQPTNAMFAIRQSMWWTCCPLKECPTTSLASNAPIAKAPLWWATIHPWMECCTARLILSNSSRNLAISAKISNQEKLRSRSRVRLQARYLQSSVEHKTSVLLVTKLSTLLKRCKWKENASTRHVSSALTVAACWLTPRTLP